MNKPVHASAFDENPEWTEADFARARPASDVLPAPIVTGLVKQPGATDRENVTLHLDPDVIAKFQASGDGWQQRINDVLRAAKL